MGTNAQFMLLEISSGNADIWNLAVVHASPMAHLRNKLWNTLKKEKLNINNHRIATGDFNSVTKREEVSNPGSFDNHRSAKFNEWIFYEALVDLGFNGQCFTWKRGNENSNFRGARLDRALCSIDWLERSTKTKVHHLAAINSDHCPILISIGDWSEVRTSDFRYQGS
ncbi:uncharacterized protein LOC116001077 [Ipomoea triloba]|uniref:uncharacterized protein LOC116001077 n=1 Tax=Ipomoea triloba TaxID=35885 RepID=UPI00125E5AD3|nr:uncharacterized protein LOC116001077 [Ipomoea triloba]